LSGGNKTVTFSITAIDDLSGVSYSYIYFNKPITLAYPGGSTTSTPFIYTQYSDGSIPTNTISPYTPTGTDTINDIYVVDKAGNTHIYYQSDLAAL
jgi:hypothetical protein